MVEAGGGEGDGGIDGGADCTADCTAVFGVGATGGAGLCGAGAMVIVRPSLLKVAISDASPTTVTSALPLFSANVAEEMVWSAKFRVCAPGGSSGSRRKTIRSRPGSVAMVGFTGEVKFMMSRGGVVRLSSAVNWVATLPTNSRRALS